MHLYKKERNCNYVENIFLIINKKFRKNSIPSFHVPNDFRIFGLQKLSILS